MALGKSLASKTIMSHFAMPVSLYMSQPLAAVPEGATLTEVEEALFARKISCVPVVDKEGRCTGVLSRTDLLRIGRVEARKASNGRTLLALPDMRAADVIKADALTITPETHVSDAARLMVKNHIHRVFVREASSAQDPGPRPRLTAVFSTKEILAAIRDKREMQPISEIMVSPVFTIPSSATLAVATDRLSKAHVSGLVVINEDEWPIGVFTQAEALEARDLPPETLVDDVMNYAMLCLDVRTPLFRAAGHAHATRARRILAVEDRRVKGILTGIDFARAAMQ